MLKKAFVLLTILFLISGAYAFQLKVDITKEEYREAAKAALGVPEVQNFVGKGPINVRLKVGRIEYFGRAENEDVTETTPIGDADYSFLTTPDVIFSIANVFDKQHMVKAFVSNRKLQVIARDTVKQAALDTLLETGAFNIPPIKAGDGISIGGVPTTMRKFDNYSNVLKADVGQNTWVVNKFGAPIGALSRKHDVFSKPPQQAGVHFSKPPGILAQSPGLIYDNTIHNPNVLGPHNVFKLNPGLIGADKVLQQNPGLVGPADMAILNPNLHGPAEYAYMMGIGAHSNSAQHMLNQGMVSQNITNRLGRTNRWGGRP